MFNDIGSAIEKCVSVERRMQYTFEVYPSVIFRLGEDLITDDCQALVELAKNLYDADAAGTEIIIDTERFSASMAIGLSRLIRMA